MIKISVVIPSKNRAKTLSYCLDSVLNQSEKVQEIIVVDDNSADDTFSIVAKYKETGVRYEKLMNGKGAQAARNHGINIATCEWIAFLDSDDIWLPDKIMTQVTELKKYDCRDDILIHTAGVRRLHEGEIKDNINMEPFEGRCYKKLLNQSGPMFQGLLVNKKKLNEINMLDNDCPSYQEWDTAIRLAKVCDFVHIRKPLFEWILHEGDTISKDGKKDCEGFDYVINKHKAEIIRLHGAAGWRELLIQNITRALNYKLFSEAKRLLINMPLHSSKILSMLLVSLKISVRGSGRLLALFSKSPI